MVTKSHLQRGVNQSPCSLFVGSAKEGSPVVFARLDREQTLFDRRVIVREKQYRAPVAKTTSVNNMEIFLFYTSAKLLQKGKEGKNAAPK